MAKVKAGKASKRRQAARPSRSRGRKPRAAAATRAIEASLAGLAHDIRTPLTGILALAELLATSDLGERERQWANAIKSGAEHLAALTTLIVDAAKAEAAGLTLRRETFPPRRLAEAVGRALAARAETKGLKADVAIARDLPAMVAGDPLRLRAALENLADNAVKFTNEGSVALAVTVEPASRSRVRLIFAISDSGIGLSKQEIARLFRPFAQASEAVARRFGGAGLGLVFVRRIARAMGGDLKLTSAPGKGSTFRMSVLVERADVRPGATSRRTSGARAGSGRGLTILCAEDNPYGRVVMNTILTELGHRADFVETGEAAVKSVARGGYDVVLMDVALPILDGIEATRRIRALSGIVGRIPVIGISGRTEAGDAQAAQAAGMNFYFTKPVSPSKLAQALASVS
jgi:CheY-like chemotaxis protein/nitrogen-specific signal transduction histidine kinase